MYGSCTGKPEAGDSNPGKRAISGGAKKVLGDPSLEDEALGEGS